MIRGIVIRLKTEELAALITAKADWWELQGKSKPEAERERWAYDSRLFRYVAAHLIPDETYDLSLEEVRAWIHFDAGATLNRLS